MEINEIVGRYVRELVEKSDKLFEDALNHFQVNLEDISWRCLIKEFPDRKELYIDATLVLTIHTRDISRWTFEKHY